jgi:hypothetical protein
VSVVAKGFEEYFNEWWKEDGWMDLYIEIYK